MQRRDVSHERGGDVFRSLELVGGTASLQAEGVAASMHFRRPRYPRFHPLDRKLCVPAFRRVCHFVLRYSQPQRVAEVAFTISMATPRQLWKKSQTTL